MSLEDALQNDYNEEAYEKFSSQLLSRYGLDACEAAAKLNNAGIKDSTARSYKPQVRQVISACGDTNPTPREVVGHISDTDKSAETKSLMVSAMQAYFRAIEEYDKSGKVKDIAKQENVTEKDLTEESPISGWITKEEMLDIENHILPDRGEKTKTVSFADASWVITLDHKLLVMTLFYTGCRVGEICRRHDGDDALSVEDVYFDSNEIELYRLKKGGSGYKRDMTPVPEKLIYVIEEYMELNNVEEGDLFKYTTRTAQNRIREIDEVYKHAFGGFEHTEKLTPHKLRHARITDIANTSGLEAAGQYVDHSNPETTNQYRHVTGEEQRDILPESKEEDDVEQLMEALDVDSVSEALEKVKSMADDE